MAWWEYIRDLIPIYGRDNAESMHNLLFTLFFWGMVVTLMGWDKKKPK